ncbi:GNAT family N-acetyltransferase [Promicromonospora sukumoe]|uniref:GNAT family N-acetyltransferase n=1 Tax=Promicromonospora sukumoe TaxID=88382 RepID=UPI0003688A97|nr:GNAT family N-acetyltransferase [Promicromonospora sukumoe]
MSDVPYVLVPTAPSLDEYLHLRSAAGLSPKSAEQAAPVLTASWAFCHVREAATDRAVAMGRTLGDGGWYFHIADIATLPEHQSRGLGRRVMNWLLDQIADRAPAGAYITLNADEPGRPLYRSLGFVETAPASIAMRLARREP